MIDQANSSSGSSHLTVCRKAAVKPMIVCDAMHDAGKVYFMWMARKRPSIYIMMSCSKFFMRKKSSRHFRIKAKGVNVL